MTGQRQRRIRTNLHPPIATTRNINSIFRGTYLDHNRLPASTPIKSREAIAPKTEQINWAMQREVDQANRDIESISGTLSCTPDDDPKMRLLLIYLANAHKKRFELRQEPEDIRKVIEYRSIALSLTPDDDLHIPDMLSQLGIAHNKQFDRLGDMEDLQESITYISLALERSSEDDPDLPRRLANLAVAYRDRFEYLGELGDIEKAIECDSQAVTMTPEDHPSLPDWLEGVGTSYGYRFRRFGDLQDLENAVNHQSRALDLTPDNHPHLTTRLANLAVSLNTRFEHMGDLNDLEQAIVHRSRVLALIPDEHPQLSTHLANLAVSQKYRFRRLGELSDLEQAMKHESRALVLTHDDHPHLSRRLANLAVSHKYRFRRLGELSDLEQTLKYESRALALTPHDHPHLPRRLDNLAISHNYRFQRLGELNDLDQAINYQCRAVTLTPDDHPDFSTYLANLAVSHGVRYERLAELSDLEQAIKHGSRVLALTPDDHPDLPTHLSNVAMYNQSRFERLGELHDLEQAITHGSRALALTPDNHLQVPIHLGNLAASYSDRFKLLGELHDLEQVIIHRSRALSLTPDDHPDLPSRLGNLARSHIARFERLDELKDLEQAIEYESFALVTIPQDHPDSCLWHSNHALSYASYFEYSHDPSHLQKSLSLFRIACISLPGSARDRFRHAQGWASRASRYSALNLIEAYQVAIDLLPQFIWLGATANQRYHDLKSVETFAVDAAHAAIISLDYSLALEWLEHARCIVWSQNLMLRSPVDHLLASYPALASRLQTVADRLQIATLNSRESQAFSRSMTSEHVAQDHHRLATEYEELLAQARVKPGFEDFLRPIKAAGLICAARYGPIVVINCHESRCDALVVSPGQTTVGHLPLPSFSGKKARDACSTIQASLRRKGIRERGVHIRQEPGCQNDFGSILKMLWADVVKPILDFMGLTTNVTGQSLPHITWCPTGATSFLPFHAAGNYDEPHSRVFDYVVSSYTPTLAALLNSTPSTLSRDSQVLAIAQAATPGRRQLPGTTAELKHVKSHAKNKVGYSELVDAQATPMTVLDAMEKHDWVHIACHAHQNVNDPTKSGFFLHDGTLDLATISQRSFKKKGLAFLSACQTATGDETLADEAVHLASGMLMAGYSSVIGTMWSVVDADAPFVADKVYSQLMDKGTLGSGEAGRALHDAVEGLRDMVGEKEFGRWVPFIHIGS